MAVEFRVSSRIARAHDKQLPCESSSPEAVGAMVVDPVYAYHRKVAELRTARGELGYLYVKVQDSPWSGPKSDLGVDFNVVLSKGGCWSFSDRSDPETGDALEELRSGMLEWYGDKIGIVRWVGDVEAARIVSQHFA